MMNTEIPPLSPEGRALLQDAAALHRRFVETKHFDSGMKAPAERTLFHNASYLPRIAWVAAAVIAFAIGGFWQMSRHRAPGRAATHPQPVLSQMRTLDSSTPGRPGTRIAVRRLEPGQVAQTIEVPGVGTLLLRAGALADLDEPRTVNGAAQLSLYRGTAFVHSTRNHGWTVKLPHGSLTDVGTDFGVSVDAAGSAALRVFEGIVEVTTGEGPPLRVERGQSWRESSTISPPDLQGDETRRLGRPPVAAAGAKLQRKLVAAGDVRHSSAHRSSLHVLENDSGSFDNRLMIAREAARRRTAGDLAGAEEIYRQLVEGEDGFADRAALAVAEMSMQRRQPQAALALLNRHRARRPHCALAAEIDVLRIGAAMALRQKQTALDLVVQD